VDSCYGCLFNYGLIDDGPPYNDNGHECADLPATGANFTNGSSASVPFTSTCLATLQCVMTTHCSNTNGGVTNCFCGSGGGGPTACASAGAAANGACKTAEATGLSHAATDTSDIIGRDFIDINDPSGMANEIIAAASNLGCPQCLE
jgi:hypothetical protein